MQFPLALRISVLVGSTLSLFWLPWPITLFLIFLSGLVFPFAALALGILADLLYYPGSGYLWGTLSGAVITLVATFVRHFVKTRIM